MFGKKKKLSLKERRTFEQLCDVYARAYSVAMSEKDNVNFAVYGDEVLKAEQQIIGACAVMGFRSPVVTDDRVIIYDSKGNILIDR